MELNSIKNIKYLDIIVEILEILVWPWKGRSVVVVPEFPLKVKNAQKEAERRRE